MSENKKNLTTSDLMQLRDLSSVDIIEASAKEIENERERRMKKIEAL